MDLKQFFDDEQAVSPVIGVILMVAITVILAQSSGPSYSVSVIKFRTRLHKQASASTLVPKVYWFKHD